MTAEHSSPLEASVFTNLQRPTPLYDFEYTSVTGAFDFRRLQLADVVLSLLIQTADFRNRAISYRGFNVGAGAMALRESEVVRVLGYNVKFDDTNKVNIHAEDLVTAKAENYGCDTISVLSVIGPVQEDHASGRTTPTLHPCGRCRGRLGANQLITPDTLVVTARPDFTAIELASLEAIENTHQNGNDDGVATFYFDKTPEVFSPLPEPDADGFVRPAEHEVDDRDWQGTVGQLLTARYFQTAQS